MNEKIIKEFLDKKNIIAVVGVSSNPQKYGNRVFFNLLENGYKVYAVHNDGGTIDRYTRYPNLKSLPEKPDVANIVVPPDITEKIVKECKELGIKKVWMQPGSESQKAIDYCSKNNIKILHGICIMVEKKKRK